MSIIKKSWKIIVTIILVLICCFVANQIYINLHNEKADIKVLNSVLEKSSELTTAKLKLNMNYHYEDSGIKLFNRSDFDMVFKVTVRAGIDISKVVITADDNQKVINVTVPKAAILEKVIDPESIHYYDSGFVLFNPDEKEDGNKATTKALEKVSEEVKNTGVLELADNQSVTLIKGILVNAIPKGYTIECKIEE